MEFLQVEVGKKFPIEKVLVNNKSATGGGSLDYNKEEKTLSCYFILPSLSKKEIKAFNKGLIRFALYPNNFLNTAILMVCFEKDLMFDLTFDINTLDIDMDGIVEGNRFDMYLIDKTTEIVHGIRSIGVGAIFLSKINEITKNDGRYSAQEFKNWIQNDVHQRSIFELWRESNRIDWDR